jgi:hypothetical protein
MIDDLKPFIICGAPGGGTSFFSKFLRANAFYAGESIEVGRANVNHLGWLERAKWHESILISQAVTKPIIQYLGVHHDTLVSPDIGPEKFKHTKELLDSISPKFWEELAESKKEDLTKIFKQEFPYDGAAYGWKDPRNVYLLPLWRYIFPDAKIVTVERKMNPNPSNIGSEGKNFTAHGENAYMRDLYYSHYDDFRFQFEDFDNVDKVNELLIFFGLKTLTYTKLRAQLKELKFMYSKIGK